MNSWLFLFIAFFILPACRQKKENKIIDDLIEQGRSVNYTPPGFATSDHRFVQYPGPKGYVNDFAHIFSAAESAQLDSIIGLHEKATTNQVAIVTFDTIPILNEEFDAFTLHLANDWGVGQKEKNNGMVIVFCKSMRKIGIQNGTGITAKLPDVATKEIIDTVIIPEFKKENYFTGIKKGLLSIIARLN